MNKWTVYIADDQTLFRKGMSRLVRSFKNVAEVREASNGQELLDLVSDKRPHAILMDLEMPIMDGVEATEKILAKYDNIKIIVLSMHDSQNHIFYMIEAGAHAFLLKNAEPEEVEQAIESVIEKDFYQNEIVSAALRNVTRSRKKVDSRPVFQNQAVLSDREKEILILISRELTNKEIGEKLFLSEKTIENHKARMMDKVGSRNSIGLVKYGYETGLIT
ncbi:response regulator transcription factor [Fulvivirga sp. M361]|uniref:response regulator transcription factor n=1 Tax=Fulvivirga sp. M361 TaxID=2594266 RepID=UPI00117A7BDA|nr:response regulator transcription factor [Fulvivirga sp. M361]TRX58707.1 response regulator transcription factor [Fulvivirga sp. M361]